MSYIHVQLFINFHAKFQHTVIVRKVFIHSELFSYQTTTQICFISDYVIDFSCSYEDKQPWKEQKFIVPWSFLCWVFAYCRVCGEKGNKSHLTHTNNSPFDLSALNSIIYIMTLDDYSVKANAKLLFFLQKMWQLISECMELLLMCKWSALAAVRNILNAVRKRKTDNLCWISCWVVPYFSAEVCQRSHWG